ncbi:hypothetical protein [Liquorilactobacillus sicerae]|uniref:hypothetical protein n=1 Tax=Liquorilactobacillus sicerae TaxID=1416943 RepID=UPI002480E0BE|nr:hypothetical protein [Liquorilactobacillus sicerae]
MKQFKRVSALTILTVAFCILFDYPVAAEAATSISEFQVISGNASINSVPNVILPLKKGKVTSANKAIRVATNQQITAANYIGADSSKWVLKATVDKSAYTVGATHQLKIKSFTIAGKRLIPSQSTIILHNNKTGETSLKTTPENTSMILISNQRVFPATYYGRLKWLFSGNSYSKIKGANPYISAN